MGARPQGASAGTQPPPGSARSNGQGAANNGALASALKGPAAVPRAPMREVSAITNFNVKAGDGSRATLIAVLLGVALAFVGIFYFTQAPPELSEEADESVRHKLPKDLVQQALNKPKTDEPAEAAEPGEPEAQVAAEPGATGATGTTEAPPPVVEKEGTAYVSSDPTVEVFLGSQSLGRTPVTAKLPVGPNKLRFTDKKTGINIYRTVRVKGGKEVREHFSFGTSELVVEAPEGAAILLNARFIGKAPLETIKIYEGSYHLKVTLDGKSWADTFDAPPGRRINYKVTLRD